MSNHGESKEASAGRASQAERRSGLATVALALAIVAALMVMLGFAAVLDVAGLQQFVADRDASLIIFGVAALCVAAAILGRLAFVRAETAPERYTGKTMAAAAMYVAFVSLVAIPVLDREGGSLFGRSHRVAKIIDTESSLRYIGHAAYQYAADNRDRFSMNLDALVTGGYLPPEMLKSAYPTDNSCCDFYYVTGLTTDDEETWILAYMAPLKCMNGKGVVLFLDGHAEKCWEKDFTAMLALFRAEYRAARGVEPVILPPH